MFTWPAPVALGGADIVNRLWCMLLAVLLTGLVLGCGGSREKPENQGKDKPVPEDKKK
jgi:hypothetical protein